jgi:endonuclease/exonuclease/phosphatase family metal-dependent hydrolase
VFVSIFTNVWGYVAPVSTPFRNQFWLPFVAAALVAGLATVTGPAAARGQEEPAPRRPALLGAVAVAAALLALTVAFAVVADRPTAAATEPDRRSLRVMTYNIQAGNDDDAQRSFDRQLALIREVDPDLVALQESDTARVGLNNDDLVRCFAAKLGWHAWYGPATVTGTFGTAILSRLPLRATRVAFTYSDTDEIGTAEAEIDVGGRTFTVYNVHPDGSDEAMLAFARSLVERAGGREGVIVLGDFNIREDDAAWPILEAAFTEAWTAVYPSRVGPDGTDMRRRIDRVMVSRDLGVRDPVYVQPPRSATDHPVHWAEVTW